MPDYYDKVNEETEKRETKNQYVYQKTMIMLILELATNIYQTRKKRIC